MNTFNEQVVLITGAGNGIGRQLAHCFAREGAAIAAVDTEAEALAAVEKELAGRPFAGAVADVTDRDGLCRAIAGLEAKLGPTDVLIANAGIGRETSALAFRADDVTAQINVNLIGVANSIEAVLPGMVQRKRGHLVGMSSLASFHGLPLMAGYCASKAGLNALLDGLRVELRPHGVHVTTICPGWIKTRLTANVMVPTPNLLELEHACRLMIEAIRLRRPFLAFPADSVRHLRLLRWLPTRWGDWLVTRRLSRLTQK